MNENSEYETYLSIAPTKFAIYLLNTKNFKNLYKKEITFAETKFINYSNLKQFLDENIFKIEKLAGKFIDNIFILIESEKILNIKIGIKQINYNPLINKVFLKNSVINAKDLFQENYPNQRIVHIIIKKYLIDGETFFYIKDNFKCEQLNLEIEFKSISNELIKSLNKVLQNYQIKITKYLDESYVKNFLKKILKYQKSF